MLEYVALLGVVVAAGLAWWRGWGPLALVPIGLVILGNIVVRIVIAAALGDFPTAEDEAKSADYRLMVNGVGILILAGMAAIGKKRPERPAQDANWKSWASRGKPQT